MVLGPYCILKKIIKINGTPWTNILTIKCCMAQFNFIYLILFLIDKTGQLINQSIYSYRKSSINKFTVLQNFTNKKFFPDLFHIFLNYYSLRSAVYCTAVGNCTAVDRRYVHCCTLYERCTR